MKLFLRTLVLAVFSWAFLMTPALAQGIVVLEYHEVVSPSADVTPNDTVVTTDQFNAQMRWLRRNGYYTISASQLAAYMANSSALTIPAGRTPIVISFDDGWLNQQNALPALHRNGFRATFNIIASLPGLNPSYMDWRQVARLAASGHSIQSHTLSHPVSWATVTLYDEIARSKSIIEARTKVPVNIITWPNGYFDANMLTYAVSTNYIGAMTIDENWCSLGGKSLEGTPDCQWKTGNAYGQSPWTIKRLFVDGRCSTEEFGVWVKQGHSSACTGATSAPAPRRMPSFHRDEEGRRLNRDRVDVANSGDDHGRAEFRFRRHH